jgi:hypothetical protein
VDKRLGVQVKDSKKLLECAMPIGRGNASFVSQGDYVSTDTVHELTGSGDDLLNVTTSIISQLAIPRYRLTKVASSINCMSKV